MFRSNLLRCVLLSVVACSVAAAGQSGDVPFPTGYREWVHVKSLLVGPQSAFFAGSGGLHHIYANDQALAGYRSGRFPAGSVIVFDLFEVVEKEGNTLESARSRIDVMQKNAGGEWEFGRFMQGSPDRRYTDAAGLARCTTCHQGAKGEDFVFSEYRD